MAPDRDPHLTETNSANREAVSASAQTKGRLRFRWFLSRGLFILGLLQLGYLLGAASMFFELPPSDALSKAFLGARAWNERREASAQTTDPETLPVVGGEVDNPERTFDGFTLYTRATITTRSTKAYLLNMRREVVHTWSVRFSDVWPRATHIRGKLDDDQVCFFASHLYPNGDLLVVFHGLNRFSNGYGLAKLDKDSRILWRYTARMHHDVDVGEDGTIYALKDEFLSETPSGFEAIPPPWRVDYLVVLSPDGKELRKPISLLDTIRNSPYRQLLSPLEKPGAQRGLKLLSLDETHERQDVFHTNSVQVLTRRLAPKFPLFKSGQVLLSIRNLHALVVLDPADGAVVWAGQGPWRFQHDARFLDNGHLLLFDNYGSPRGSRVLEYDPQTHGFPWSYEGEAGEPFFSMHGGRNQRLPNGNTLIVNSEKGEIQEVTQDKEVVWSCSVKGCFVTSAHRFAPEQLQFLKGDPCPRP
jgi:hypothetical protein